MKKKLNIGVDMDGVIANWQDAALKVINATWPELNIKVLDNVQTARIIYSKLLRKGIKISEQEIYKKLCPKGFFLNLDPYEHVYETIKFLSELGNIYIVTKPIEFNYTPFEKAEWLKTYLKDIDYKIIFTQTSEAKGLLNLDIMIDDDPNVFYSSQEEILFFVPRQPWNKDFQEEEKNNNRICFIDNLSEVIETISSVI